MAPCLVLACLPANANPAKVASPRETPSPQSPKSLNHPTFTTILYTPTLSKSKHSHKTQYYNHFLITATMADNPLPALAVEGPPKHIGRWKSVIDMLLGNRIISQNGTGHTPSLDNIRDDHKQRGLLLSDANQALDLSRMPNRAQDAGGRASGTAQSAAAQSGAQQPRWGGPGGKKMYVFMPMMTRERANPYRTPRELAAYEVTQRHLQQPFQPIDLFRKMWGDNHAEPAFWSG